MDRASGSRDPAQESRPLKAIEQEPLGSMSNSAQSSRSNEEDVNDDILASSSHLHDSTPSTETAIEVADAAELEVDSQFSGQVGVEFQHESRNES